MRSSYPLILVHVEEVVPLLIWVSHTLRLVFGPSDRETGIDEHPIEVHLHSASGSRQAGCR